MGIKKLLKHLPGGGPNDYSYSFFALGLIDEKVILDGGGFAWQYGFMHAEDFVKANYMPSLRDMARDLKYIRDACRWRLVVILDGKENEAKAPEDTRRRAQFEHARETGNARGQVKNNPEYTALIVRLCQRLGIEVHVARMEADPQTSYEAKLHGATPVSGDSDLLAYGVTGKLILVKSYHSELYRIIDLDADVNDGEYPLLDLFKRHGKIVFQLYAGCRGCDFTQHRYGIVGVGYKLFLSASEAVTGQLTAGSLAAELWAQAKDTILKSGRSSSAEVKADLQKVVDVYEHGLVYSKNSDTIDIGSDELIERHSSESEEHMSGSVNCRTGSEFSDILKKQIESLDVSQLINRTSADVSQIRGATLPKEVIRDNCCDDLRDFVGAHGGNVTGRKADLEVTASDYQFMEKEVPWPLVDRAPAKTGSLFVKIDTSSTRDVGKILDSILSHCDQFDSNTKELVELTHQLFNTNQFDSLHDNIAKIAPELKVGLIHRTSSNVGSNIESKNDGGAFARCLHTKSIVFHAMAFVPDKHNVILISKIQASMKKDEKTREKTAEGEAPDYQTYLVINELKFVETNNLTDKHALGVFTEVVRSYCFGDCVAGEGDCIHKMIQLWIQFHHWTDERLGIDRPPTLDNCSWGAGKPLESGVTKMLHEQQCVKHCMSVEEQISKNERGSKRACTEGVSAVYKVYASKAK